MAMYLVILRATYLAESGDLPFMYASLSLPSTLSFFILVMYSTVHAITLFCLRFGVGQPSLIESMMVLFTWLQHFLKVSWSSSVYLSASAVGYVGSACLAKAWWDGWVSILLRSLLVLALSESGVLRTSACLHNFTCFLFLMLSLGTFWYLDIGMMRWALLVVSHVLLTEKARDRSMVRYIGRCMECTGECLWYSSWMAHCVSALCSRSVVEASMKSGFVNAPPCWYVCLRFAFSPCVAMAIGFTGWL